MSIILAKQMHARFRRLLICLLLLCLTVLASSPPALAQSSSECRKLVLWNGFLEMVNILELVNTSGDTISVTVTLYDITGTAAGQTSISLPARVQQDVIVNSLQGFSTDSYGIVEVTCSGDAEDLAGRLSFYRYTPDGEEYEFAFFTSFSETLTGTSAVGFNTYQPSTNAIDAANLVSQWLSIVNLDPNASHSFTVYRYNQVGELIVSTDVDVEPLRRVDISGGHENPGPGNVGQNVIVPTDSSAPYLAHLVRYGEKAPSGYSFAFPLTAAPGSADVQWVSISSGAGAENWLELVNRSSTSSTVQVRLINNSGETLIETTLELAPYSQSHILASEHLPNGTTGAARITPITAGSRIYAQSMFYFRDSSGSIEAMYGAQARAETAGQQYGSYNLYLNMYNWLRIFNTTSSSQTILVRVRGSRMRTQNVTLCAHCGTDLGLHETSVYGTAANTFGVVSLNGTVLAEVLRIRPTASGGVDFASPTSVVAGPEDDGTGGTTGSLIYSEDFTYLGAFRLPEGSNGTDWLYSGHALAYYPDGDPGGDSDGYGGSLFGSGHNWYQQVSEISIPAPVISASKNLSELNTATTLQEFTDIKAALGVGELELPQLGLEYLPAQGSQSTGKLHFVWGEHNQYEGQEVSQGWAETNLSAPQTAGGWFVSDLENHLTNNYLFAVPSSWADLYAPGMLLASGRFREGGQAGQGPSLVLTAPWLSGNPPAANTRLDATVLLRYSTVMDDPSAAQGMTSYAHSDDWTGGAWVSAGDRSAVVFVGTKGVGETWYGYANGLVWPEEPPYPDVPDAPYDDRGWWSTSFNGQFLFYDPTDLAAVAQGTMQSYEPQPYDQLDVDSRLFHITESRQRDHLGAAAFDSTNGRLYVFETYGDGEKSLIHIWSVN